MEPDKAQSGISDSGKIESAKSDSDYTNLDWRSVVLAIVSIASLFYLFSLPVIVQSQSYHDFADQRAMYVIANYANVLSNIAFMLVGGYGLWLCRNLRGLNTKLAWQIFFIGVALVALGSAYYHFTPSNSSLFWDRLPMTVGFMALFAVLLAEFVHSWFAKQGLLILLLLGFISLLYWLWFDDLRLYYWLQLLPIINIPLLLLLYPAKGKRYALLWGTFALYLLAKVCEHNDKAVYQYTAYAISGHTLKHLLASMAILCVCLLVKRKVSELL
ncbi:hypothetical protein E2K93_03360 [Thalassotalea sp. HSM 43]|uniref:ceramidase domain-containing protein n=1 Tax=Thalassotalea sp. HSM 43 TaxID=2552945 RepID=UPI001080AC95|nr:ceramidase domain-containing protein [Thalassotalea sp. HSM 43]QBY03470.1 hypothetical protein E2K93_03360 [Thalassotalea sp. HSM 43]